MLQNVMETWWVACARIESGFFQFRFQKGVNSLMWMTAEVTPTDSGPKISIKDWNNLPEKKCLKVIKNKKEVHSYFDNDNRSTICGLELVISLWKIQLRSPHLVFRIVSRTFESWAITMTNSCFQQCKCLVPFHHNDIPFQEHNKTVTTKLSSAIPGETSNSPISYWKCITYLKVKQIDANI